MMRTVGRVLAVCSVLGWGFSMPGSAAAVTSTAVTFTVSNTNQSMVPCQSDGATYQISGHLVAPDTLPGAVTLYLHGLGFGEWFWNFNTVSGYDFAGGLAVADHASVIIDRLGYGQSVLGDGSQTCLGAQATIAHQIIQQLRNGTYTLNGVAGTTANPNPQFSKVALAGHSAGGAVAEIEAYSFHDVDGLIVMSYADQGASPDTLAAFVQGGLACATGAAPRNFTNFGQTPEDFAHLMFNTPRALTGRLPVVDSDNTAADDVIAAATLKRNPDPCGDDNSFPFEIVVSQLLLSQISAPVLLICGDKDAVFPPPACDLQALHFLTNGDFTNEKVAGGGHALTLGFTAGDFRQAVGAWLTTRGF